MFHLYVLPTEPILTDAALSEFWPQRWMSGNSQSLYRSVFFSNSLPHVIFIITPIRLVANVRNWNKWAAAVKVGFSLNNDTVRQDIEEIQRSVRYPEELRTQEVCGIFLC